MERKGRRNGMVLWDSYILSGRSNFMESADVLLIKVVMREAAENESSGRRSEQHRSAGRKQSVLSIPAITMSTKLRS